MRLLVCIDDTDNVDSDLGTGRQSRRLAERLAEAFPALEWRGCVRQQLLVDPRVPYTTHNSCACMIFESGADAAPTAGAIEAVAGPYLERECAPGSDPGLCIARRAAVPEAVTAFGRRATEDVVEEAEAWDLAERAGLFLDEYGGTGEGVIGALAGVGLTAAGDSGRFIAYGRIREYDRHVDVETLRADGVRVVDDAGAAVTSGTVDTHGWVRPHLRGHDPVLPVVRAGDAWEPANL
ncbi:MAG: hypothetical protein ABEJ28_10495 [Salinigranum sp.]